MATTITLTELNQYKKISSFDLTYGTINTYAKFTSQSVENNQTSVTLQSRFTMASGWTSYSFDSATAKLDGTTKSYSSRTTFSSGTTTIQTKNITLNHTTDGSSPTKSVTTSWTASFGGSGSATVNIKVPKIDRYPMITSADNFSDEGNPTIQYTTVLGFSGATVSAGIFDTSNGVIADYRTVNVENGSYTFNLTNEERSILRTKSKNSPTLNVVFKLKTTTTSNTDYISPLERTMTIINANPTYTRTKEETKEEVITLLNGDTTAETTVQNASIVRLTIVPTALKEAEISSVSVIHNNITYTKTSSPYVFDINILNNQIGYLITDSRGNTNTGTQNPQVINFTMINYKPVSIDTSTLVIERENPTSQNVKITLNGYYQNDIGSYSNVGQYSTVEWKVEGGSFNQLTYNTDYTISNNQISISNKLINSGISYSQTKSFTIRIADRLAERSETRTILKGVPTFEYGETDLQVNGDLFIADTSRQNPVNVLEAINGIVESGSNSRGYYTKFANGLMICYIHEMSIARTGSSTLGGASVNYGTGTWTFPQTFVTPITCLVTARDSGSGVFGAETDGNMGTSSQAITCYGANVTYKVNALAIGRWKA